MENLIEIKRSDAASIYGGKDPQVAKLVEFIAECVGSIFKMLYMANNLKKMLIGNPLM